MRHCAPEQGLILLAHSGRAYERRPSKSQKVRLKKEGSDRTCWGPTALVTHRTAYSWPQTAWSALGNFLPRPRTPWPKICPEFDRPSLRGSPAGLKMSHFPGQLLSRARARQALWAPAGWGLPSPPAAPVVSTHPRRSQGHGTKKKPRKRSGAR